MHSNGNENNLENWNCVPLYK